MMGDDMNMNADDIRAEYKRARLAAYRRAVRLRVDADWPDIQSAVDAALANVPKGKRSKRDFGVAVVTNGLPDVE